jgi:hypothetical protein
MAVGEQVKISSDTVHQGGSAADDARSLGVVLQQTLAPRMPGQTAAGLPEPFAEIVRHCLVPDPQNRWSMAEVSARLERRESQATSPPPAVAKKPSRWPVPRWRHRLIVALRGAAHAGSSDRPGGCTGACRRQLQRVEEGPAGRECSRPSKPKAVTPTEGDTGRGRNRNLVLPDIPSKARSTIGGR